MSISPYLFFDGTCREAVNAYADIFGGEIVMMMTFGDAPAEENMPPEIKDLVMHVTIKIGDAMLMASDDMPGKSVKPASTHVMASLPTVAEAKSAFERLSDGGDVKMPFDKTFWAEGFGVVIDKWGTPWMIGVDGPMPE